MGSSSKIGANTPNCHIWAWNLESDQSSKSCTYTPFLPQGVEIEFIFALHAAVSEIRAIFSKLPYLGMKLGIAKVPEVAHIPSFYPRGSKLSLFLLYGQRFPRYGPIFKIDIFGHETWPLAKVPEVANITSFYPKGLPQGVEIDLIFVLRAAVSEIRADFTNYHIWAWNLVIGQRSRSCTYTWLWFKNPKF